jgi:hypothetical protein
VVRRISLSFGNRSEAGVTDFVLDTLASGDVRATFFVLGSKLGHDESLRYARRAAREGHRVATTPTSTAIPSACSTPRRHARRSVARRRCSTASSPSGRFAPSGEQAEKARSATIS